MASYFPQFNYTALILLLSAQAACNFAACGQAIADDENLAPLVQSASVDWGGAGGPISFRMTDQELIEFDDETDNLEDFTFFDEQLEPAQYQSRLLPLPNVTPQIARSTGRSPLATYRPRVDINSLGISNAAFQSGFESRGLSIGVVSYVRGREAPTRLTTDIGDLLKKSPSTVGTRQTQKQPIVTDTQVRGSKAPQIVKSGSYWVPARMDLDTGMSKIDSRLLEDVVVIRGPYSSVYGPGFDFIDFELQSSPRYDGFEYHGSTWFDYESNGEQVYGRQTILAGDNDSGFRFSYGHRTGNDYQSGNGTGIPSSYKSRDIELVYGIDIGESSRVELYAIRLDQTDVEMPGQAFDIDYLITDAYELKYINEASPIANRFELATWYNRTELAGSAQRAGKRRQFPFYDDIDFVGNTDVDSMSTGYTTAWTWEAQNSVVTAGTDLRYVKQEINEITSGSFGFSDWQDRNSPLPRSHQSNPGLFLQRTIDLTPALTLTSGGRIDLVSANIDDSAQKLDDVAIRTPIDDPLSLAEILGTDDFDRDFMLGSAFFLAEWQMDRTWTATLGYGYAERAPTLTELYAAEPFMFLLQNGLNTVTGSPDLDKEKLWQIDAGISFETNQLRGGLNGFHGWIRDYITYENARVFRSEQTNLQFVNTDLATLFGGEFYAEYDASPYLTTFTTVSYIEGRDHSRDGSFTTQFRDFNSTMIPSQGTQQVAGARGAGSGVVGADEEPLPNMAPLETRVGVRLHQAGPNPNRAIELAIRILSNQDRIATSLLETGTPGFTVWDLRGYWRTNRGLTLIAGVENFTDEQYREYLDFRPLNTGALAVYQPGINFYFGTELNY